MFWADWIKTVVYVATESSHSLIMGKLLSGHKISTEIHFGLDQMNHFRVTSP